MALTSGKSIQRFTVAAALTILALCAAAFGSFNQAWASEGGDNLSIANAQALSPQASQTICQIADVASGKATWDSKTRTVTLNNATIDLGKQSNPTTISAIDVNAQLEMSKPTITIKLVGSNKIIGGSVLDAPIRVRYANLKFTGKGSLAISSTSAMYNIQVAGSLKATSGTLKLAGGGYGIMCDSAAFSGATVAISNPSIYGIYADGNISIKKGKVKVTGAGTGAIASTGKVSITGGTVTAKCENVSGNLYSAIYAGKGIANKAACLKAVKGALGVGASFYQSGNKYKVTSTGNVTLVSYGASSKSPTVNEVTHGGVTYYVRAIAAKAFATKRGKAITGITLGSNVNSIGANAFYGTSKLAKMNVRNFNYLAASYAKTSFKKCGKANGAKLKVVCNAFLTSSVKTQFTKYGMSKKAAFVS